MTRGKTLTVIYAQEKPIVLYCKFVPTAHSNKNNNSYFLKKIFNIFKGLVSLLVSEGLISSALHLTLSESGPLAELLVYLLVTLRPCTRLPGVYTLFIQKIWLA